MPPRVVRDSTFDAREDLSRIFAYWRTDDSQEEGDCEEVGDDPREALQGRYRNIVEIKLREQCWLPVVEHFPALANVMLDTLYAIQRGPEAIYPWRDYFAPDLLPDREDFVHEAREISPPSPELECYLSSLEHVVSNHLRLRDKNEPQHPLLGALTEVHDDVIGDGYTIPHRNLKLSRSSSVAHPHVFCSLDVGFHGARMLCHNTGTFEGWWAWENRHRPESQHHPKPLVEWELQQPDNDPERGFNDWGALRESLVDAANTLATSIETMIQGDYQKQKLQRNESSKKSRSPKAAAEFAMDEEQLGDVHDRIAMWLMSDDHEVLDPYWKKYLNRRARSIGIEFPPRSRNTKSTRNRRNFGFLKLQNKAYAGNDE